VTTQCEVFIATSLDGFIAREDGSIDWLNEANQAVPPETIPVLLGKGNPLFGKLPADVRLQHKSTKAYPFGFVQSEYVVNRGASH
jgi:dihydrofolate reductase